jgi:hypothetical protein
MRATALRLPTIAHVPTAQTPVPFRLRKQCPGLLYWRFSKKKTTVQRGEAYILYLSPPTSCYRHTGYGSRLVSFWHTTVVYSWVNCAQSVWDPLQAWGTNPTGPLHGTYFLSVLAQLGACTSANISGPQEYRLAINMNIKLPLISGNFAFEVER